MNVVVPHGFEINYTAGLLRGLQAAGVEFCVIASDADVDVFRTAGMQAVNLRGSVSEDRPAWRKLANLLRYYLRLAVFLARRRPATVHFTGVLRSDLILLEGLLLPALFALCARRYVYTAHNVLPHDRGDRPLQRWIHRRIYRAADTILVHSAAAERELVESFAVAPQRILRTSIGVNEEVPATGLTRAQARLRLGCAPDDRVLLFFGKINRYKGLDLLLQAFETLEPARTRLLIAGAPLGERLHAELSAAIDASPRRGQIRFDARSIPNEEVEAYFKAADLLVLPYRAIAQSGLLFLALRFGLPVVATPVGAFPEFIGSDLGLLAERPDAAALQATLQQALARLHTFSPEAIVAHGERYRWPAIAAGLAHLYR